MRFLNCGLALCLLSLPSPGQSTFIYDQQSSDERFSGGGPLGITPYQPIGQSFTPALSSVDFVRFELLDGSPGNGRGSTIYVNLRTDAVTGPVLSSTTPVVLPDGLGGPTNAFVTFFFATPVAVTPGVMYYFQPIVQSGEDFLIYDSYQHLYPGGASYYLGQPSTGDLWFREGIIPEPSAAVLTIVCVGAFLCLRRRMGKAWVSRDS